MPGTVDLVPLLNAVKPNFLLILPEIVLVAFTLIVLVADLYTSEKRNLAWVSLLGIIVSLAATWPAFTGAIPNGDYFGRMVAADPFTHFMKATFLVVAAGIVLLSTNWAGDRIPKIQVEYYELLMFATLGLIFMAGSRDLVLIYMGLELSSQCSYVLAGLLRKDPKSNEAALKYFLNGSLASAVLLFGISLLYGATGATYLPDMFAQLTAVKAEQLPLLVVAVVFMVGGFAFKVAAAPFHQWAPDAYEGAPTPVTGFFSVGPKAAAFAAILRIFLIGLATPVLASKASVLWAILAAASMFIGNLTALWQSNVKRMMAYSSISHAGYILVGVAAGVAGGGSVLYYILGYALTNLGIWAAIVALENQGDGTDLSDFKGLAERAPVLAWSMVFLFISLIGIPPTVGFFGKFYLFQAAIQTEYTWLAILMAINSAISVGYYYAIVRNMFFEKTNRPAMVTGSNGVVVALSVLAVLLVGLGSGPFIGYASTAIGFFSR